ncbi:MAG TPA: hypothetical protein VFN67_20380 [Polyangiales bacterium]|nr:hypothetical protein [Polyangiales bacterium]
MGNGGAGTSAAPATGGTAAASGTSATAGTSAPAASAAGMASAGTGMAAMDVPEDGDPTKPMVDIPGLKCGVPTSPFQTTKITDRDVAVAYPCAHEGAPVTFFLFIHGTLNEQMKISFTMNAYAVHELVDSHNLIVVTPKSVVNQWGNGDNGVDLPHLYEVVDWTYKTFGDKFNIKSMWAHGGSWGAAYLNRTFACDPMFEKRLNGVLMVVGPGCPACSDRMSCVVIQQSGQECSGGQGCSEQMAEMLVDDSGIAPFAMQHGCDGKMGPSMVGPVKEWAFPNCDPGWYHSYFLGPGQHADKLDQMSVVKITEAMKATEKK